MKSSIEKAELLSPAGNFEKLRLALAYGADAVYGGVSAFSLRVRSGREFTYESFAKAIDYTHKKGKKIYVTINGFPFNAQIPLLEKHIIKIAELKPDAFIVATPGVIKMCQKFAPNMPLHLSTQANVLNYMDAQVYHEMGVKRIVAAREVGLKDLAKIKEKLPNLQIEVFVHGSMCFAYSGRCLISSVQSGRVPNRGSCANDCRFSYELYAKNEESGTLFRLEEDENGTHILNAKDLNLASRLDEVLKSGVVDALKIEGRTKSPYYVATTAKTYRQAIDDFYSGAFEPKNYEDELNTTKNRGFSQGYLVRHPSEKQQNLQNLQTSISEGSYQVYALVSEDGKSFKAKDTIIKNQEYEIMASEQIQECKNEIGEIKKKDEKYFLTLFNIKATNNKEFEEVHSGNIHDIILPCKLTAFSFLRLPTNIKIRKD
ncbi:MAG: collagenase-like protease [Proteobacteria bacterium]|nr:MAG: collagenase-like protease [Pseudomonadota bacterium]